MPFLTLMTNIKAANLPADLMPKWVNVNATSSYDCHNYLLIMVHDIKWLLPFFVAQNPRIKHFLVLGSLAFLDALASLAFKLSLSE